MAVDWLDLSALIYSLSGECRKMMPDRCLLLWKVSGFFGAS